MRSLSKAETFAEVMKQGSTPKPGGHHRLRLKSNGGWKRFGFVSDTHLGSKHYRADVLESLYRWFREEGITEVFHGGNWIEGQTRFNQHDIEIFGMDGQLDFFLDNYPQHKGITTHYIAGDDHEGWYQQREIFSIGQTLEDKALRRGRTDLHFLGYVEADIELVSSRGSCVMRLMHAGGGSSYAVSYRPQKIVESFTGGDKPAVLLIGHYHKLSYNLFRNVHCVQGGCTVDQSIFMRKKSIEAHLGGVIISLRQSPDGAVTDFVPWIRNFFDKGYYEKKF